jgi:hypothetical protein
VEGPHGGMPCTECGSGGKTSVVLVRVYSRRTQDEFRYRLCDMCKAMVHHLLKDNCESWQRNRLRHEGEFRVQPGAVELRNGSAPPSWPSA